MSSCQSLLGFAGQKMNALAKEFETTSQLPPSTPQQRMTPPTVLLPATFAILPPQSAALSAAIATVAPPRTMPLLGCSVTSAACRTHIGANPSMALGAASMYAGVDIGGYSGSNSNISSPAVNVVNALNEAIMPVSEMVSSGFSVAAAACTAVARPVLGNEASPRMESKTDGLSILLPPSYASTRIAHQDTSPAAAAAASTGGVPSASLHQRDVHRHPQRRPVLGSPADAGGGGISTTEEDDLIPLTSASSTYATRRSVSAFDDSDLATFGRTGGSRSRVHRCSSRSSSSALPQQQPEFPQRPNSVAAIALRALSPAAYAHGTQSDVLWQRHGSTHAAAAATAEFRVTSTPLPAPSGSSTPPTISSQASTCQSYPFYPNWGADSVCAFCPITSFVEMTSHEENSDGRASTCSSTQQQRQPRSRQQQRRTGPYTPSGGTSPSSIERHAAGPSTAALPSSSSSRRHRTRMHVCLHEGPVMMATPVSPSMGRRTPLSPLYIAPALCFHTDPARPSASNSSAATQAGNSPRPPSVLDARRSDSGSGRGVGGERWSFINAARATSRPPTPPSMVLAAEAAAASDDISVYRRTTGTPVHAAAATSTYDVHGESSGAMDPLSDFPTRPPSQSHSPRHPRPHTLLTDGSTQHLPCQPTLGLAATADTVTAVATGGFPGNLTFLPIEVQPASTMPPFFGSVGNVAAAGASPVGAITHPRATVGDRCGFQADSATGRVPSMSRVEHPVAILEEASSSHGCCCPPLLHSATTPAHAAHAAWPPYAAPGLVTAILAAPEVSWSSFNATVAADNATTVRTTPHTTTGVAATPSGGEYRSSRGIASSAPWLQQVGGGSNSSSMHDPGAPYPNTTGCGGHPAGGVGGDDRSLNRSTIGHAVSANVRSYSAALPSFNSSIQFQLACSPVPLEDTESECVICLEGHPSHADNTQGRCASVMPTMTDGAVASATPAVTADFGGGVKPGSQLLMMPCKHCCHQNCLQRWLIQSTCCPICRRDLTQDATLSS
ncbi:hypothetical protein ABB37_06899 [Leptomonas pyrrhocoris]|uniref:RING-type domain-containing protein n=1 Tax=Leptomonas pyrrhocoris TaxID=157538 RepID=A0A0M9FWU1_LEPPY|nr:hypothetical protein ABB37_06899 [Leptomonas pyrrhocoris]KPA77516.1 hypothetical protein ABB37_06899 [Leptomonas pyrrhocoris]|eukprot:XP_015655955.1 hypothetical protein ABB37_06899 [Leptomonas pyrrhocoris]